MPAKGAWHRGKSSPGARDQHGPHCQVLPGTGAPCTRRRLSQLGASHQGARPHCQQYARAYSVVRGATRAWNAIRLPNNQATNFSSRDEVLVLIAGRVAHDVVTCALPAESRSVRTAAGAMKLSSRGGLDGNTITVCRGSPSSVLSPLTAPEIDDVESLVKILIEMNRQPTRNNIHYSRHNNMLLKFTKGLGIDRATGAGPLICTDVVPCGEIVKHDDTGHKICRCKSAQLEHSWESAMIDVKAMAEMDDLAKAGGCPEVFSMGSVLTVLVTVFVFTLTGALYGAIAVRPLPAEERGRAAFDGLAVSVGAAGLLFLSLQSILLRGRAAHLVFRGLKILETLNERFAVGEDEVLLAMIYSNGLSSYLSPHMSCLVTQSASGNVKMGRTISADEAESVGIAAFRGLVLVPGNRGLEPYAAATTSDGSYHITGRRYGVAVSHSMPAGALIGDGGHKLTRVFSLVTREQDSTEARLMEVVIKVLK